MIAVLKRLCNRHESTPRAHWFVPDDAYHQCGTSSICEDRDHTVAMARTLLALACAFLLNARTSLAFTAAHAPKLLRLGAVRAATKNHQLDRRAALLAGASAALTVAPGIAQAKSNEDKEAEKEAKAAKKAAEKEAKAAKKAAETEKKAEEKAALAEKAAAQKAKQAELQAANKAKIEANKAANTPEARAKKNEEEIARRKAAKEARDAAKAERFEKLGTQYDADFTTKVNDKAAYREQMRALKEGGDVRVGAPANK